MRSRRSDRDVRVPRTLFMLLPLLVACLSAGVFAVTSAGAASDREVKKSLQDVGAVFKKFGKKIGEGGKEAGHEIAEVAKKIWYKGKRVSQPLLRDVQKATKKFWEKVIEGKDRTIEALGDENKKLRRDLEEDE